MNEKWMGKILEKAGLDAMEAYKERLIKESNFLKEKQNAGKNGERCKCNFDACQCKTKR